MAFETFFPWLILIWLNIIGYRKILLANIWKNQIYLCTYFNSFRLCDFNKHKLEMIDILFQPLLNLLSFAMLQHQEFLKMCLWLALDLFFSNEFHSNWRIFHKPAGFQTKSQPLTLLSYFLFLFVSFSFWDCFSSHKLPKFSGISA